MPKIRGDFKKILLILIGRLGDYIITTAFHKSVRTRFPKAKIIFLTSEKSEYLAQKSKYFNKVLTLRNWLNPANIRFLFLGRENYDMTIDLNPSYSRTSMALVKLSGAPLRISFKKRAPRGTYTHMIWHDSENEHFLDKYANLASFFNADYEPKLEISIDEKAEKDAEKIIAALNINADLPLVFIHPGNFKKKNNRWPEEKFVELTKRLSARHRLNLFYISGPGEKKIIEKNILSHLPQVKMIPPQKIDTLGALLKKSNLLICNNTSTLHLAEAVGARTLSFNSIYNEKCWRPRGENHFTIISREWSSCVNISVEEAFKKFNEIFPLLHLGALRIRDKG